MRRLLSLGPKNSCLSISSSGSCLWLWKPEAAAKLDGIGMLFVVVWLFFLELPLDLVALLFVVDAGLLLTRPDAPLVLDDLVTGMYS